MGIGNGILGFVEKAGNRLPDPVFIFVWFIGFLVIGSVAAAAYGLSAVNPVDGQAVAAQSLLSSENLRRLFVDMPKTLTGFAPLGYVLVVMLGAGVAERTGLFSAAMRAGIRRAPKALLTPIVVFVGIVSNHASDAGYVVLVPLAGLVFAAAGRHPVAGIAAGFAAVSGGFSANLFPGHLDALLLGLTEPAARLIQPDWTANIAGNWYFIVAMTVVFVPLAWFVTDRIIEPRLGPWQPTADAPVQLSDSELSREEKRGLWWAGLAALLVIGAWTAMSVSPNPPLVDLTAEPTERMTPFYQSLVAGFFVLFLATGVAFGVAARTLKDHRHLVKMLTESMAVMAPYIVLAFVAAHFVAMFNWSNLGVILAILGAEQLSASGLPAWQLLIAIVLLAATVNIFIGSASAKWAAMAPVMVPMLMLLGISPEMATAAYRMGDSVTNIITPLMVYFPLILGFCQRWVPGFGVGNLMATMLPYSFFFLIGGAIMTGAWVFLDLPLGGGETVHYDLNEARAAVQAAPAQ
ncbi:AbgT family transporter [Brevundimonas balnearis]|uniref:AbgT family transporter n=1 Tax=Brevundimonas balnearis TaxID=1572858 RepID=A0ABV6R0Y8_9CAUL